MRRGEMDDGEERDNGCEEERKQTGAALTHTHTFSAYSGL